MRSVLPAFISAVILMAPVASLAADELRFPAGAEAREARLLTKVGPQTRAWIKQVGAKEAASGQPSEAAAIAAARSLGNLQDADIQAVAFLVLMEATRDTDTDLRKIKSEAKQTSMSNQAVREQIANRNEELTAHAPASAKASAVQPPAAVARAPVAVAPLARNVTTRVAPSPPKSGGVAASADIMKNKLDSMSEMNEMTSLRLQMMMDRRSKFIATLSNIMKKISSTQDTLVQNLK